MEVSVEQLERDGFGTSPLFEALILEFNSETVGFALFYYRYSTWKGKSLYLEDLYVDPEYRNNGIGLAVMKHLVNHAIKTDCKRFEWQVLDWNTPSIEFYKKIGAELDSEWINCKLRHSQ
ncbi:MAG: GNAT family N-acetyltransferase, partial [Calditrichaeota bacterium]|nr:GNAT family N-acetyltransferase [Calditrichota bacterium]